MPCVHKPFRAFWVWNKYRFGGDVMWCRYSYVCSGGWGGGGGLSPYTEVDTMWNKLLLVNTIQSSDLVWRQLTVSFAAAILDGLIWTCWQEGWTWTGLGPMRVVYRPACMGGGQSWQNLQEIYGKLFNFKLLLYIGFWQKNRYLLKGIDQVVYMIRIAKAKVYDVLANFRVPIFYRRQKFA